MLRRPSFLFRVAQLDHSSSSGDQVNDQHDHGCDQQQMDQAACHMEAESQEPENQQDGEDCPEHIWPSLSKSSIDKMGPLWLVLL